jgi:hypothetical protein
MGDCAQNLCYPGANGCDGETFSVCNGEGSDFVSAEDDCIARGLICSPTEGCVTTDVAAVAFDETDYFSSGNEFLFNKYHMSKSRRLVQVEQAGKASNGSGVVELSFLVYESDSADAAMKLVAQTTTTTTANDGFRLSSGPLDVLLASGKYYAIGVRAADLFAFQRSYDARSLGLLSFGEWVGAGQLPLSTVPTMLSNATAAPEPLVQFLTMTKP